MDEHDIRRRAHRNLQITAFLIACGLMGVPSLIGSITGTGSRAQAHPVVTVTVR